MTEARALLTGGTGFLGSRVACALLDDGWAVTLLSRAASSLAALTRLGIVDRVTVARLGIGDLLDEIATVLDVARPDVIFHLAAASRGRETPAWVAEMLDANVTFPTLLIAAAHEQGVAYVVNAGSSWQTASGAAYTPFNVYAATKQAFEDLLVAYAADDMSAITLRLFDTYGTGDVRQKIVDLLLEAGRRETTLRMSPGDQVIDLVHVDDAARAFVVAGRRLLGSHVRGHEVYAVSGARLPLRELAGRVSAALGRPIPIAWGARDYRPREIMQPATHLPRLPGWTPETSLDAGLRAASEATAT